jgi:PDZ domain-containing protein
MEENLPVADPATSAPGALRAARVLTGLLVLLVVAAVLTATFVRVPYFVFRPGSVQPLSDRVNVVVGDMFEPTGEIHYTTVRQDSTVNGWEWLEARLRPSLALVDEDLVLGGRTRDENRSFNFQLMRVSKSTAVAVALRYLGIDAIRATGVGMAEVLGPSEGVLTTDDVILSMDGVQVFEAMDLVVVVRDRAPGEVLELVVEPVGGGEARTVLLTLGARDDDPTIGFMGIVPQTRWEDVEDLPIDVKVNTGRVGGNSAGLALTLSILDLITPGELTGGLQVATTGTIDLGGMVGPVGGVAQKAVAAREGGIDLFLVPETEFEVARRHAGDMVVEPVTTLQDALDAMERHGGQTRDLLIPDR